MYRAYVKAKENILEKDLDTEILGKELREAFTELKL